MLKSEVIFVCNVCGLRAREPVLCVKQACPTPMLVYGVANKPIVPLRVS